MSKEIEEIVNGDVDLYEFLEVKPSFELNEIKRQYRRKALQYHPDKNPSEDAAKKFHLLSRAYEILTNEALRSNYDRIRQIKINKIERLKKLSEQTRIFKEELEKAEQEHRFNNSNVYDNANKEFVQRKVWENNLEKLKEEGLKKRRKYEKEMIIPPAPTARNIKKYLSFQDMPFQFNDGYTISCVDTNNETVNETEKQQLATCVKWKHKPELKDLFTHDILQDIMMIFGPVKSVKLLPNTTNSRYDTGIVHFENPESARMAISHDYRKSATLWDGTKVRKLASLLRECTYNQPNDVIEPQSRSINCSDESKVNDLKTKPNQTTRFKPPSQYTVGNFVLKSDTRMDQIIRNFVIKETTEI